jgi:hypothetical protein
MIGYIYAYIYIYIYIYVKNCCKEANNAHVHNNISLLCQNVKTMNTSKIT